MGRVEDQESQNSTTTMAPDQIIICSFLPPNRITQGSTTGLITLILFEIFKLVELVKDR